MPAQTSSKMAHIIASFGWIIALASLALNWAIYNDSQKDKEREEKNTPVYSYELSTYPTKGLPTELLTLKQPIEHQFVVRHYSGKKIEGLVLEFRSENAKIIKIDVTEGQTDTKTTIHSGGNEASLKKSDLIPNTSLRGTVITEGIVPLSLSIAADSGQDLDSLRAEISSNQNDFGWKIIPAIAIIIIIFSAVALIFYYSLPAIKDSGIVEQSHNSKSNTCLLVFVFFLFAIPDFGIIPSANHALSALILYLLIVNYKKLSRLIDKLTKTE